MTFAPTPSPDTWKKPDELRLRRTEVRTQIGTGIAQAVLSVATVAAVFVALWVALQGQQSLKSATQNNLQQAQDNQFSTALTSLGSTDITERIAGLALLELNVADRLTPTSIAAFGKPSAYNYYTTALEIYSGYLQSHGVGSMTTVDTGGGTQPFGSGYGALPPGAFSIDTQYAADEIAKMLSLKNQVHAVSPVVPAFDLANDELYEVNLEGTNFSWVNAYMFGIDLRGAVLEKVRGHEVRGSAGRGSGGCQPQRRGSVRRGPAGRESDRGRPPGHLRYGGELLRSPGQSGRTDFDVRLGDRAAAGRGYHQRSAPVPTFMPREPELRGPSHALKVMPPLSTVDQTGCDDLGVNEWQRGQKRLSRQATG